MLRQDQIIYKSGSKVRFICDRCKEETTKDYYTARDSKTGNICIPCSKALVNNKSLDVSIIREFVSYDPVSGRLSAKCNSVSATKGELLDTAINSQGYRVINIGGSQRLAHRIIWLIVHGVTPTQIDHIDRNRTNNVLSNLRDVSAYTNQRNMSLSKNNTTGVNGVRILPSGRYCAYIFNNRKQISLGTYDTLEEAKLVREQANIKYGYTSSHGK